MRIERPAILTILIGISCSGVFLLLSGCVNTVTDLSTALPVAKGHVYLDGKAVSGASVEAISANGTDNRSTTTDDKGAYALNITPDTRYNVTATYQGLRHTVWPVCLPGEADTFDINLTTTPTSMIEGSGYTTISVSPWESKEGRFKIYDHTRWSGFLIEAKSRKDNTTISAVTDNNGSYSMKVEPDTRYGMDGYYSVQKAYPRAMIHYRNMGGLDTDYDNSIIVGPNETALIDYIIPMP